MDVKRVVDVDDLNPVVGDIYLSPQGRIVFTDDTSGETVAQRLRIRFAFWRGEYFADTRLGVPYVPTADNPFGVLGEKFDEATFGALLRNVILSTPGIASLRTFSTEFDAVTRVMQPTFVAILANGLVFDTRDFAPFLVEF